MAAKSFLFNGLFALARSASTSFFKTYRDIRAHLRTQIGLKSDPSYTVTTAAGV